MGQRLDNARKLYLEAINDGNYEVAINSYAGDRYTQHSTPVKDGKAGFIEFFADFVERNPVREIEILRAFEDGQYVFLHVLQTLNGGEFRYVTADIFDTDENAKLIEHWDIIAELSDGPDPDSTVSDGPVSDSTVSDGPVSDSTVSGGPVSSGSGTGHPQIDGPTEPTDLHRTDENKSLVGRYLGEVLGEGRLDRLDHYVSGNSFTQHSPELGDGLEALRDRLAELAADGRPVVYEQVHNVIGCGSLVAALSKVNSSGTPMAVIDLFRVDDGLIVEHWDVAEEITPPETWVNSGKF